MAGLQDLDLTGGPQAQHGHTEWQARDTCNGEAWGARVNPRDLWAIARKASEVMRCGART